MNCISERNFDEKYERYKSLIFRIGIVYLGNRSDADTVLAAIDSWGIIRFFLPVQQEEA
ncbi:MAG: hypothetical protein KHW59_01455 [Clostridiales bacterium]|nr:hypothetical protein [Clostridiales bacterium]